MRISTALAAMGGLYAANWVLSNAFDVYGRFPNFDVPMHYAGGFAAGMLAVAVHHETSGKEYLRRIPWYYHAGFILGTVALIAVAWEFHEFVLDWLHGQQGNVFVRMQPSIADTMGDMGLGLLGGASAFFAFRKQL
jgi:uncharacterized membrane protein YjdF